MSLLAWYIPTIYKCYITKAQEYEVSSKLKIKKCIHCYVMSLNWLDFLWHQQVRYSSFPSLQHVSFSHVCSLILFGVLVSIRILDVSEEIARVVLLASLDFIMSVSCNSLRELTYKRCEMASKRVKPPLYTWNILLEYVDSAIKSRLTIWVARPRRSILYTMNKWVIYR